MTLRHFEVFLSVCDLGGMTAAAERLHVAQSAVSRTIRELETFYGVRLFERLAKRIHPTAAARELVPGIRHLLSEYAAMEELLREKAARPVIRVGASVTVGSALLPALAAAHRARHAGVGLRAVVDNTRAIEALLLRGEVDLGYVEGSVHAVELVAEPVVEDELVVILPAGHGAAGTELGAEALLAEPLILREAGSGSRELFERAMAERGLRVESSWVCNSVDAIKRAVATGAGLSILSLRSVREELALGALSYARIAGTRLSRNFSLVRHRDAFLSAPVLDFMALCREKSGG